MAGASEDLALEVGQARDFTQLDIENRKNLDLDLARSAPALGSSRDVTPGVPE
ncbi:hypothetical protein ACR820_05345 [Streptomyces netropsis]